MSETWPHPVDPTFLKRRLMYLTNSHFEAIAVFTAPWTEDSLEAAAYINCGSLKKKKVAALVQTGKVKLRIEVLGKIHHDRLSPPYRKGDFLDSVDEPPQNIRTLALNAITEPTKHGLRAAEIALLCHGDEDALAAWRKRTNFKQFDHAPHCPIMAKLGEEIVQYSDL